MAVTAPPLVPFAHDQRARETRRLLVRYHRFGDAAAREELIARFLPLARQLARRYHRGREPFDDLVQVASLGLIKAVDRFDLERGTSFSSYAVPIMLGELRRHFRDTGWTVHVPRGVQELALDVERAAERLREQHGRTATPADIARELHVSVEDVTEALGAVQAGSPMSLDAAAADDPEGESRITRVRSEEAGYDLVEFRSVMGTTLAALSPRDRAVLHMRFAEGLTQTQIAERVGLSQMSVSRMLRRITDRLRHVAAANAA